jgi:hypothetical protein
MIGNDRFTAAFGSVPAGDPEHLVRVAVAAVRHGFAIVVNEPGTKKPLCILTAREMKAADKEVQEAARQAGDTRWARRRHECGWAHAITDDKTARKVVTRLVKERGPVNLGVEVGRSRMLCVDVDTAAEKAAFLTAWSAETGEDKGLVPPTVVSPGRVNQEGTWVHKDGGHYWFTLPEGVDLAALPGKGIVTGQGGWVAIFRDKQVIVPPSVRAEGPYQLVGQVEPAPQWLLDRITMEAEGHAERKRIQGARVQYDGDPIDGWSIQTPWADLLLQDGWTATGLPDRCDCPVWTRPGDASTPKSATAHELGCTQYDMVCGHGPLHLWTDNPPEFLRAAPKTLTKLDYVAFRDHQGDRRAAMDALSLDPIVALPGLSGWVPPEFRTPAPETEILENFDLEESGPSPALIVDVDPDVNPFDNQQAPGVRAPGASGPGVATTVGGIVDPPAEPLEIPVGRPVLDPKALHGLAGQMVRLLDPYTEADPAAVLFCLLAYAGCMFGRGPHLEAAGSHPGRVWPILTGSTSAGAKGTAMTAVSRLFHAIQEGNPFLTERVHTGLSSSEGLIKLVRDMQGDPEDEKHFDPGVRDKRTLILEAEFASVLGRARREGNTISATLRDAYDGGRLQTIVTRNPMVATEHHITVLANITPDELVERLAAVDVANGFANRFLVVYSERSKLLPDPGFPDEDERMDVAARFQTVLDRAADVRRMTRTEAAGVLWAREYISRHSRKLPPGSPVEAMFARWHAHAARLSVVYALLDGSPVIDVPHLEAALAAWDYVEASVLALFNNPDSDHDLGRVMEYINEQPGVGVTRTQISKEVFQRNRSKKELDELFRKLLATGRYQVARVPRTGPDGQPLGGRPTTVYYRLPG